MNEARIVDILYIVPTNKYDTYRRAISLAMWTLESNKTFDLMSADEFVRICKGMSGAEIYAKMCEMCVSSVNTRDISRREWKEFGPLWDSFTEHFRQVHGTAQQPHDGAEGER